MDRRITQATVIKDRHMDFLYTLPAVQGAGIGLAKRNPRQPVIQVFVSRRLQQVERRKFPKVLEGVPVEILVTGAFHTAPAKK